MTDDRPDFSKMSEHEKTRWWVQHWKRLGPELERIKKEELRALGEKEATDRAVRVMDSRSRHAGEAAKFRRTSGLVEQQRILGKARLST